MGGRREEGFASLGRAQEYWAGIGVDAAPEQEESDQLQGHGGDRGKEAEAPRRSPRRKNRGEEEGGGDRGRKPGGEEGGGGGSSLDRKGPNLIQW